MSWAWHSGAAHPRPSTPIPLLRAKWPLVGAHDWGDQWDGDERCDGDGPLFSALHARRLTWRKTCARHANHRLARGRSHLGLALVESRRFYPLHRVCFVFFLFFFVFDRDVTWFYCFTVLDSDGLRFAGLPSSSGGDFAGFYWVDPSIFADGSNYIAPSRPRSVSFMPASSLFFYLFHCWLVFLLPSAIHKEQSRSMMLPYSLSRHECAPATNYSDTFCGFYLFCAVIPSPTTCISLLSPFTWIFRFDPVGALYLHNVAVFLQYTMSNWAWEVINSTMLRFLEFVFHSLGRTKPPSVLFLLL